MPTTIEQQPLGVHLVGSVPLSSTEEVLQRVNEVLGDHLLRLPDGETGSRWYFTKWQYTKWPEHTIMSYGSPDLVAAQVVEPVPEEEIARLIATMDTFETEYDKAATESYEIFQRMKKDGLIRKDIKFQVCLPTPINPVGALRPPYRAAIEPLYEAALLRALTCIQAEIPASELAIQWDMAFDMGVIEGLSWAKPGFEGPTLDKVVARAVRLVDKVEGGIDVGFHLCYGDQQHKHFLEPESMATMVDVANAILSSVQRPQSIKWFHMPVPKARDDAPYFEPLKGIRLPSHTMLYLGLVHFDDHAGTMRRIKAAQQAGFKGRFGLATECGLGRTPATELDSIFQILKDVSSPVV